MKKKSVVLSEGRMGRKKEKRVGGGEWKYSVEGFC